MIRLKSGGVILRLIEIVTFATSASIAQRAEITIQFAHYFVIVNKSSLFVLKGEVYKPGSILQ